MAVDVFHQIYNVLALYASPTPSTGFMFSLATVANPTSGNNMLTGINRVQSCTIDTTVPRVDVNQDGMTNRIDQLIVTSPTSTMSLDYYLTDGSNENLFGFAASGQQSFCSGLLDGTQGDKNYFLSISPEGIDNIGNLNPNSINVVALGNGYISNYTQNLAVGQIPRATVTIEASNQAFYIGATGNYSPAINYQTALPVVGPQFTVPPALAYTGANVPTALRPGDITLSFPRTAGLGDYLSGVGMIHPQSVSLSVPIALDTINQIGTPYPIARKIRLPVDCTLTVDALVGDVETGSLAQLFCSDSPFNLSYAFNLPSCTRQGAPAMTVWFNQAKLSNRSYNSSIGSNATVRLTFTNQLQGNTPGYLGQGIVISGSYGEAYS